MRYLTLAEGLLIASAVTGLEVQTIQHVSRVELVVSTEIAVSMIIDVASGVMSQSDLTRWIGKHRSPDNS